jgi:hypothetical protein
MTPGGGNRPGSPGGRGPGGRGPGFGPGQGHQQAQWSQNWGHNHNWNHNGNWNNNNNWNWNNSSFWWGFFAYPAFAGLFNYGYWGFDCYPYCSYSPFYYYGLPYVYPPRVDVVEVPTYTYSDVPAYDYGNGYYMSQGQYTGLDAALNDIKSAWVNGRADLMLAHIDSGTQIAIYLDGNYSYSISGADYSNMVKDAIGRVRTISMTLDNVQQRSDGAYTATGTHQFYDINGSQKTVSISFTLANSGGRWTIVEAGSSEGT